MEMSEYEIVKMYEQALYPEQQIAILADLNATRPHKIAKILAKHGKKINMSVYVKCRDKSGNADKQTIDIILNLRNQGNTYKYIGDLLGRSESGIMRICKQHLGQKNTLQTAPTV